MCPSHKMHDATSLALAAGLLYAGARQGHFVEGALLAAGAATSLILSSDLDQPYSMARLRLTRRFGILARAWCAVYDHLFRHRGLSHTPVLGTLTRLAWLVLPLAILAFLCYLSPPPVEWWPFVAWWVGGLMLADTLHAALDWGSTAVKRWARKSGKNNKVSHF